jgi:PhoPQ-activated pathogenicity-related protein
MIGKSPMLKNLVLPLLLAYSAFAQPRTETALDRYVAQPDASYHWSVNKTIPGAGYTATRLEMTSQNWRTPAEVSRTEWKHWVTVIRPETVTSDIGLLMITGGDNVKPPSDKVDALLASIATRTQTVVVELRMVPNQPLSFFGETRERVEDAIIGFTWQKYLQTGDERWPLQLPMTKSAVRAMDAATEFLAGDKTKVSRWVVTGGSKRGWTTWLTAAVDKRVIAIMPIVIDMLNMEANFKHHYRVYGYWAPAVDDYVEHDVMNWMNTVQFDKLMAMVEPFHYRERLTLPKFLVNSGGDQFFIPDSSQFYFDQLKGEKYLRYVPNSDHGVTKKTDAGDSLASYYESIVKGWKRPEFDWKIAADGTITVKTKTQPAAVKLWQASNPNARDFRLEKIGPAYASTDVAASAPGVYTAKIAKPAKGYTAGFVELTFNMPNGKEWKFTTAVKVIPDVYPFPAPTAKLPKGATPNQSRERK